MYVFGVMLASVAITTYALDSYPARSGKISYFLSLARACRGFTVGYFQQSWDEKDRFGISFGVQAVFGGRRIGKIYLHKFERA
jgi:hypothetical protein